jgi:hypothetical protein
MRELFYVAMLSCTCAITGLLALAHLPQAPAAVARVRLCTKADAGLLIAADRVCPAEPATLARR